MDFKTSQNFSRLKVTKGFSAKTETHKSQGHEQQVVKGWEEVEEAGDLDGLQSVKFYGNTLKVFVLMLWKL